MVKPGAGWVIRLLVCSGAPGWATLVCGIGITGSLVKQPHPLALWTHTHTHIVVSELSAHFGKTVAWQRSPSHPAWEELRSGPSANAGSLFYHRSMCVSLCEGGRPTSLITDWELDKFEASIKTNTSHTPILKANSPSRRKTQNVGHKRPPQSFQKNIYHLHKDYYIECIALEFKNWIKLH